MVMLRDSRLCASRAEIRWAQCEPHNRASGWARRLRASADETLVGVGDTTGYIWYNYTVIIILIRGGNASQLYQVLYLVYQVRAETLYTV